VSFDTRHNASDEPTRLAHLNHGDQGAVLIKNDAGFAEIIWLGHRNLHGLFAATRLPPPHRSPHSIFGLLLRWLAELLRACIMALTDAFHAHTV
jgi:hypothetical protein